MFLDLRDYASPRKTFAAPVNPPPKWGERIPVVIWGDSTSEGLGVLNAENSIRSAMAQILARQIINQGITGNLPITTKDRFLAMPDSYANYIHVVNFGYMNPTLTAPGFMALVDECWAARKNDLLLFCVPGPGATANEQIVGGAEIQQHIDARKLLMEAYPDNYIDQMKPMWDWVTANSGTVSQASLDSVPAFQAGTTPLYSTITDGRGWCPPDLLDNSLIHRTDFCQSQLEAVAITDAITAKGW